MLTKPVKWIAGLIFCLVVFGFGNGPVTAQTAGTASGDEPLTMTGLRLGTFEDYSRLIMTFNREVATYEITRADVDQINLDFGPADAVKQGLLNLEDRLIKGVIVEKQANHLLAMVKTKPPRFNFRAFLSPDRKAVVVDFRPEAGSIGAVGPKPVEIELPPPAGLAKQFRSVLPRVPQPETPEAMLASAMDYMSIGKYQEAAKILDDYKNKFFNDQYRDPAYFFLGDCLFFMDPEKFKEQFPLIVDTYKSALGFFPDSEMAPRANFLLGLAYLKMEFPSEAIKIFKQTATSYPGTLYAHLANTYLCELYLGIDKPKLAEMAMNDVLAANPTGDLFRDKYFILGQYYFREGLFSQSTEVFKEILNQAPEYYLIHPEILYYLGEGYYHLKRMPLARAFLFHSLNIEPDQKDADIIMARIGDSYKEENDAKQAVAMYDLTRKMFPKSLGDLVSQLRMAEFGALRKLFPKERIFYELENGVEPATMKIYEQIMNTEQESPLIQLALFKLAGGYLNMEEYNKALKSLQTLLEKYPKSPLIPEVMKMADQAILSDLKVLYYQRKYPELIAHYQENAKFLSKKSMPEVNRYLGMAFAALNKPDEAAKYLAASQTQDQSEDLDTLFTLGETYLKVGKYADAIKNLSPYWEKKPDDPKTSATKLEIAKMEFNQGLDDLALKHLTEAMNQEPSFKENADNQKMLVDLYQKLNDMPNYVRSMEKYMELTKDQKKKPEQMFQTYVSLGEAYLSLNQRDQAAAALDKALENRSPKTPPDTLYVMANMYRDLGMSAKRMGVLGILAESSDPFWKNAAKEEMSELVPNKEVDKLLNPPQQ